MKNTSIVGASGATTREGGSWKSRYRGLFGSELMKRARGLAEKKIQFLCVCECVRARVYIFTGGWHGEGFGAYSYSFVRE